MRSWTMGRLCGMPVVVSSTRSPPSWPQTRMDAPSSLSSAPRPVWRWARGRAVERPVSRCQTRALPSNPQVRKPSAVRARQGARDAIERRRGDAEMASSIRGAVDDPCRCSFAPDPRESGRSGRSPSGVMSSPLRASQSRASPSAVQVWILLPSTLNAAPAMGLPLRSGGRRGSPVAADQSRASASPASPPPQVSTAVPSGDHRAPATGEPWSMAATSMGSSSRKRRASRAFAASDGLPDQAKRAAAWV